MKFINVLTLALMVSACSSSSSGSAASPQPTPSVPTSGWLVLVHESSSANQSTVEMVDLRGHVSARADFTAPAPPHMPGCAAIVPPAVRVAGHAAYYADSTGVIRRLDPDGTVSTAATFKLASQQQFLSYAVSPDGQNLMAIVVSTPPLLNPIPASPASPYVAGEDWTLDLESAAAGGQTKIVVHSDLGANAAATGALEITGWDATGPTAELSSLLCAQQQLPSLEYTGTALVHLSPNGAQVDQIGGSDCVAWDELEDGTVLCGAPFGDSFSVRSSTGAPIWDKYLGCCIVEAKLSPDGHAVSVNAPATGISSRDTAQVATFVRLRVPVAALLGWAGNDYVVAAKQDGHIGLVPLADAGNFVDLGLVVENATQAGSIDLA